MKGDADKVALLPTTYEEEPQIYNVPKKQNSRLSVRWVLKRVLVFYGFVTLYVLARRLWFKHEVAPRGEKSGRWALKAFGPHAGAGAHGAELNVEELFL